MEACAVRGVEWAVGSFDTASAQIAKVQVEDLEPGPNSTPSTPLRAGRCWVFGLKLRSGSTESSGSSEGEESEAVAASLAHGE